MFRCHTSNLPPRVFSGMHWLTAGELMPTMGGPVGREFSGGI